MPLNSIDARGRLRSLACSECMFTVGATVTIAGTSHGWCLNHLVKMVHPLLAGVQRSPEALPAGVCVACGDSARVVHVDDGQWHGELCPGHALAYLSHSLSPIAFRNILTEAGTDQNAIFALHDDFYTDQGDAWQPAGIALPSLSARIHNLRTLPDYSEDTGYAWEAELYLELVQLARADYRHWSGLEEELTDFLADVLVCEVISAGSFRRSEIFAVSRPVTDQQTEALRATLEPVLAATIPAAGDPVICRRLSGWMSERLWAGQTQEKIARILALGLSGGTPATDVADFVIERDNESFVAAAAERIYREILPLISG